MSEQLALSVIIVNWNTRELLRNCLRSVYSEPCGVSFETFVVDNASSDGSADMVRAEFSQVQLIANEENLGYSRANNLAMRRAAGENMLLLNSDTVVEPRQFSATIGLLHSDPKIGALGCRLVGIDGAEQVSHHFSYLRGYAAGDSDRQLENGLIECAHVWGAYLLVKHEVVEHVGMLDEDFFIFHEDTDWCWRMHDAGWKIVYDPNHTITHVCRASCRRIDDARQGRRLLAAAITLRSKHIPGFSFHSWRRARLFHHKWRHLRFAIKGFCGRSEDVLEKSREHAASYRTLKSIRKPPPYAGSDL